MGDYDGFVTADEIVNFFRAFGSKESVANVLFDHLAGDHTKNADAPRAVSYHTFVNIVGPYLLELQGAEVALQGVRPQVEDCQWQLHCPYGTSTSSAKKSTPDKLFPCPVQNFRRSSQHVDLLALPKQCTPDDAQQALVKADAPPQALSPGRVQES